MNFEWLKRKELGLPLWAWGLITAVVVFVGYRWYQGRQASSASNTAASALTSPDAGAAAGSLIPPPPPSFGAGAPSAAGTDPLPIFDLSGLDNGFALPTDNSQNQTNTIAPPPPGPISAGPPPAHPSQTGTSTAGTPQLDWGGLTFGSKSEFQTWCALHGTSVARELALHPRAAAIYATLPAGSPSLSVGSGIVKSGTKTPTRIVQPRNSQQLAGRATTAETTPSTSSARTRPISDVGSSINAPPAKTTYGKLLPGPANNPPKNPGSKVTPGTRFVPS